MITWFKDFCVVMGFVHETHPWHIDHTARGIIRMRRQDEALQLRAEMVHYRIKEITKGQK